MNPVRVFFVNDTSLNNNWGCRATSFTLKQMIRAAGGELSGTLALTDLAHPNWQMSQRYQQVSTTISQLTKRSSFTRKASSAIMNRLITGLKDVAPRSWSEFEGAASLVLEGKIMPQLKEALANCDVVLINGEGGILQNQRESRMMFFVAYLAKKYFDKAVAMVSHTAELSHPVLNEIATQVYPLLDDVVFRDALSQEACKVMVEGRFAADVTFAYEPAGSEAWAPLAKRAGYFNHWPEQHSSFDASHPFICIGGSSMFSARHKQTYNPQEAIKQLCLKLADSAQVVITASARPDEILFKPIADELNLPFIPLATSATQAVDLLGNASLYIGGRWHGGIFALTGGTPVVSFAAETYKQHALMQAFDLHEPFDTSKLELQLDAIVELSQDYLVQGDALRQRLKAKAQEFAASTSEHVRLVKDASASSA